jgi:hypothetical protein
MAIPIPPGYCTVDEVCEAFPQFERNAIGSIQDSSIEKWIVLRKTRIRSTLLSRGYDPDIIDLTADQASFLSALNVDGAAADLGDALQASITLQQGEYSLAAARRQSFERVIKEIKEGVHDSLFRPGVSRTADIRPLLAGIGGAEVEASQSPSMLGQNKLFAKNTRY